MLEEVRQQIMQLKGLVSLKFVDPSLRQLCMTYLQVHFSTETKQENASKNICLEYIAKIEDSHEKMMAEVSQLLNLLTHSIDQCQQQLDSAQQELAVSSKSHQQQIQQQQSTQRYLNEKIQNLSQELQAKDQEIREINAKLEEKQAFIEVLEKDQHECLVKLEADFWRQQKNLEQALFVISKKDQQIRQMNSDMTALKNPQIQDSPDMVVSSPMREETSDKKSSHKKAKSDDSCSLVNCSLVSSPTRSPKQYEELHLHGLSRQGERQQVEDKPQTLRQMLNVSLQKEYKLKYTKLDRYELSGKENYNLNWMKSSKSVDRKAQWGINCSLELLQSQQPRKIVPQFQMSSVLADPYYLYFLIASQNVKIRSDHFQAFSTLPVDPIYTHIMDRRLPLHEWQTQIEKELMRQISLAQ